MSRTPLETSTSTRIAAVALALIATLATLQSIDALASRDHGETLASRAASHVVAAAVSVRQAGRRG